MLKAVLFDLDKTLHDKLATLRVFSAVQCRHFALQEHGVSQADWQRRFIAVHDELIPKRQAYARLATEFGLSAVLCQQLIEDFDAHSADHAQAFAGLHDLIDGVRALGLKTALVSNGRDFIQRHKCRTLGLDARLDALVISESFGSEKPAPAIFQHAAAQLGLKADECLFIGDNLAHDIQPARALGMATIWKSSHSHPDADYACDDLPSILDAITWLNAASTREHAALPLLLRRRQDSARG